MLVPSFVLPALISLCAVLVCVGLFFLLVRSFQFRRRTRDEPGGRRVLISPVISPLLMMLLSWPTLVFALLSSTALGVTACQVGFYPMNPAPLAGSLSMANFNSRMTVNARDGSVQQNARHVAIAGRSGWLNPGLPVLASSVPTEANGLLYFNSEDATSHMMTVSAYRLSDGSQLWSTSLEVPQMSEHNLFSQLSGEDPARSPAVADGMVYVEQIYRSRTSPQQVFVQFYALHASSGSVVWSLPLQKIATPYRGFEIRAGSGVFMVFTDGSISAWHATDGSAAWHFDANTFSRGSQLLTDHMIVVAEQTVYVGIGTTSGIVLVALRTDDGQRLWLRRGLGATYSYAALISRFGTHLYLNVGNNLEALDATNGNLLWQAPGETSREALEARGVVYVTQLGADSSTLDALKASDGSRIWRHTFTYPATALGILNVFHNVLFVSSSEAMPSMHIHLVLCPGAAEPANTLFALNASDGSIYWLRLNVSGSFTPLDLRAG